MTRGRGGSGGIGRGGEDKQYATPQHVLVNVCRWMVIPRVFYALVVSLSSSSNSTCRVADSLIRSPFLCLCPRRSHTHTLSLSLSSHIRPLHPLPPPHLHTYTFSLSRTFLSLSLSLSSLVSPRYEGHEVKKHCMNFILKNFEEVSTTKGFEDLSTQPQLLLEVTRESMSRSNQYK